MDAFSRSLDAEYAPLGVRVQNQSPMFVATKMSKIRCGACSLNHFFVWWVLAVQSGVATKMSKIRCACAEESFLSLVAAQRIVATKMSKVRCAACAAALVASLFGRFSRQLSRSVKC